MKTQKCEEEVALHCAFDLPETGPEVPVMERLAHVDMTKVQLMSVAADRDLRSRLDPGSLPLSVRFYRGPGERKRKRSQVRRRLPGPDKATSAESDALRLSAAL